MKKVIIAEKPSVAKNIADAYNIKIRKDGYFEGDDYLVTWAFGHLFQLFDAKDYDENMKGWRMDKFPFIPEEFKYKVKCDNVNRSVTDKGAEKQINIIKTLIDRDDVDGVISATDQDREGELISLEVFMYLNQNKPIYRLLLNEWTPDEVRKGMNNLKENIEMKSLQDAGISRQWADWIIGINLTSVATLRYGGTGKERKMINIGRVLLPTLKIIYDRDKEIENFKASTYYKLLATFKTKNNEEFEGTYYNENDNEKFEDKKVVEELKKHLKDKEGEIIAKQVEKKREYAPLLFNLSNLQGYITSKYKGWTLLYEEQIKFVDNKRIFDNSKVESHSAITPTYIRPTGLSKDEEIVYNSIKNRFIMQFMPIAEFEETKLTVKIHDEKFKGIFAAKGRVQIVEGWRVVEKIETKDTILPFVSEKEMVQVIDGKVNTVTKKPPKLHNEKTLLRVMETCGKSFKDEEDSPEMMQAILSGFSIGTPATRAETIKKLKDTGYIKSKGKSLTCTDLGKTLVEIFPVKELLNLQYTGRLEKTLSDIEKGKFKKDDFLSMIKAFTVEAVEDIKKDTAMLKNFKVELPEGTESIGKCPVCGNDIIEGEKGFGCTNWKNGCKYTIWKNDKFIESMGKKVTKEMVKLLLKNGKVGFRNLKSKKGTLFSAYLRYEKDEKTGYYNWKMEFIN